MFVMSISTMPTLNMLLLNLAHHVYPTIMQLLVLKTLSITTAMSRNHFNQLLIYLESQLAWHIVEGLVVWSLFYLKSSSL
jgi:hypothetical protein